MSWTNLENKVVVVTGGAAGIGLSVVKGFVEVGAKVMIADFAEEVGIQAVEEANQAGNGEADLAKCDVTSKEDVDALIGATINRWGSIDVLVNNAGTALRSNAEDTTNKDWQYIMDLNLNSVYWLSKEVYPHMKLQGSGKIINIGSMYSIFGSGTVPSYSTTKGGIVQLTKSLAVGWAKDSINVNAILPGWIKTNLTNGMSKNDPERYRKVSERIAIGKWGIPEDLAGAAIFLASRASDYITGTSIVVDGGYSVN